jgi:predicted permease
MGEFFRRIRFLINRQKELEALESDMAFHREMAAREGSPSFGNAPRLGEEAREAWGWTWLDRLVQDLRFAARILRRSPGFTVTAVLVLAIGVGMNVTAFSLFNLVALKPLPVRDPQSLVWLERRSPENINPMPYSQAMFYRQHARTLSAVMTTMGARMSLASDGQQVAATFVTANYFSELGIPPALGRLLDADRDEAPGAPPVAALSYQFWEHHFAADPAIVGKTIRLDRKAVTVVGVTPEAFGSLGGDYPDVWLPITTHPYFFEGSHVLTETANGSVTMWGRLAPGVRAHAAEQELLALTNELRREHPKDVWDGEYIHSESASHMRVIPPQMYPILGMAAALVLLILAVACANLGGLMIARGVSREHEMSTRVSIGATRSRIFRQLFTESLLVAILGAGAGLLLSYVAMRITLATTDAPRWMSATPDWRVLLFTSGVAFVAAILFGFAPALQIARQRQQKTLARQVLIGGQVAATCILLIVASLLVRGVLHALYTDPGFGYEQVISIDPALGAHSYTPAAARNYIEQLEARLRALPGVTSVALSQMPPLSHDRVSYMQVTIHGKQTMIYPDFVDPEFFRTMGIPLVRGRNLLPGEDHAVIVSDALARRVWPGQDALGKPFNTDQPGKDIIVGIAGDAHLMAVNDSDATEVYWAAKPDSMDGMALVVKTAGAPEALPASIRAICASLDPKIFPEIQLLKAGFHTSVLQVEQIAAAATLMGIVALILAAVGLVGLVAYAVSHRMKEIAIRIALGAGRRQVLVALLKQFSLPVILGALGGMAVAAAASGLLRHALFGISNHDPLGYGAAVSVLIGIIAVAAMMPARRAVKVDIARELHYE